MGAVQDKPHILNDEETMQLIQEINPRFADDIEKRENTEQKKDDGDDPIKHVVLLLLENHSFDQVLGCFQAKYPDLDGIDPHAQERRYNTDNRQIKYYQKPRIFYTQAFDPVHEHVNVMRQLSNDNGGFILDFISNYPKSTIAQRQEVMSYFSMGSLPAMHGLADDFLICDRWFSSVPSSTWPNRYFVLSGTSSGYVVMPDDLTHLHLRSVDNQTQPTLFDRLREQNRTYKVYYHDFAQSLALKTSRELNHLIHYHKIEQFYKDVKKNESTFPDLVFIEPRYYGKGENDGHPPHNVLKADKLVADVYNAIRSNPSLWSTTLLMVYFDEHGGFYDHVTPPATVPPDNLQHGYDFKQLGVRVPAILVSPWVKRGVNHTVLDHTSMLKYLIDKWNLGPLGDRAAQANSLKPLFESTMRDDTTSHIYVDLASMMKKNHPIDEYSPSKHQNALHILASYFEKQEKIDDGTFTRWRSHMSLWWSGVRCRMAARLNNLAEWIGSSESDRIDHTLQVHENLIQSAKKQQK